MRLVVALDRHSDEPAFCNNISTLDCALERRSACLDSTIVITSRITCTLYFFGRPARGRKRTDVVPADSSGVRGADQAIEPQLAFLAPAPEPVPATRREGGRRARTGRKSGASIGVIVPWIKLVIGNKNYSSWSMRPWLLMTQLGIAFEEERLHFGDPTWKQRALRYAPTGLVPILVDGELAVWDSLAIVEYLAEAYPNHGVWPAATAARARARSIVAEIHAGFSGLGNAMHMNCELRVTHAAD